MAVMCERRRGLGQALLASLLVSASSVLVKASEVPVGQAYFLASLTTVLFSLPVALYFESDLFPVSHRWVLLLFSALNTVMVVADYNATRMMPLGDEAVLAYTSIIFTVLLARYFLGEECGRVKVISSVCILVGVALITQPGAGGGTVYPSYGLGCVLTLGGALCDAVSYIIVKELTDLHCSVVLINCGIASMMITGPMSLFESWTVPKEPVALVAIIAFTFLHDIFFMLAIGVEEAGLVSFVQASDIVFSYFWELLFFDEPYSLLRLTGAGLVTSAVCAVALMDGQHVVKVHEPNDIPLFAKKESSVGHDFSSRADEMFKWLHLRER